MELQWFSCEHFLPESDSSVEEGASSFLDIRLCHDSYVPKQVVLLLLKLITKDQGKL